MMVSGQAPAASIGETVKFLKRLFGVGKGAEMHDPPKRVDHERARQVLVDLESIATSVRNKRKLTALNVSSLQGYELGIARARSRLEPAAAETVEAFRRSARAGAAMFCRARAPAGTVVPVPIGEHSLPAGSGGTASEWLQSAWAAIATADDLALGLLLVSPPPPSTPGVTSGPWVVPLSNAIIKLWTRDPTAATALKEALDATDPERLADAPFADLEPDVVKFFRAIALDIIAPGIEALYRVFADRSRFESALGKALELHHEHWRSRPDKEDGWVALFPLAVARMARDRGIPFDLTSEYLPPAVLEAPPRAALGCPYCVTPIEAHWPHCASCLEVLGRDASFELAAGELATMERKVCVSCGCRIPQLATRCATCRAAQR